MWFNKKVETRTFLATCEKKHNINVLRGNEVDDFYLSPGLLSG